jgi:hypothetical protein
MSNKQWSISIGLYPGILFGARTYNDDEKTVHVLYLPLVDFALEILHNEDTSDDK